MCLPSWLPRPFLFDYKRYFMQLFLAILYTIISILDFIHHNPSAPSTIYWIEVTIIILQYFCFLYLAVRNFDWPIFQGMIRQFDILTLTFCILFIFSLDSNQLKFLSIFWIIAMDCIRCKDKLFMMYVLFLAVLDSSYELFQQLIHSGQITDYLIDINGQNLHLHSLEVSCIFVIIVRLFLPLYKLRPSHYSMAKKLLFVRKNRYRRDLLRYAVSLHRKSKVDTLEIRQTFGSQSYDEYENPNGDEDYDGNDDENDDNDNRTRPHLSTIPSVEEIDLKRLPPQHIANKGNMLNRNNNNNNSHNSIPLPPLRNNRFSTTDEVPSSSIYYKKKRKYVPPQRLPLAQPKPLGMSIDEWIYTD